MLYSIQDQTPGTMHAVEPELQGLSGSSVCWLPQQHHHHHHSEGQHHEHSLHVHPSQQAEMQTMQPPSHSNSDLTDLMLCNSSSQTSRQGSTALMLSNEDSSGSGNPSHFRFDSASEVVSNTDDNRFGKDDCALLSEKLAYANHPSGFGAIPATTGTAAAATAPALGTAPSATAKTLDGSSSIAPLRTTTPSDMCTGSICEITPASPSPTRKAAASENTMDCWDEVFGRNSSAWSKHKRSSSVFDCFICGADSVK